jgi:hypothetical protein
MRTIVLVGCGLGAKDAPYDDPDVEIWGMGRHWRWMPRCDRIFEMHDPDIWRSYLGVNPAVYAAQLREAGPSVVVRRRIPSLPKATVYPMVMVENLIGGPYFVSSASYMLALAIVREPELILLFGINVLEVEEYVYQRPNLEYLLGLARGRGIKFKAHKESALCTMPLPAYGTTEWFAAGADTEMKRRFRREG